MRFAGPSGAVAADVTHPAIRATVFATVVLANNLIGLAPGPFITGALADALGLDVAMRIIPVVSIGAAVCFLLASRSYDAERGHYAAAHAERPQARSHAGAPEEAPAA